MSMIMPKHAAFGDITSYGCDSRAAEWISRQDSRWTAWGAGYYSWADSSRLSTAATHFVGVLTLLGDRIPLGSMTKRDAECFPLSFVLLVEDLG